MKIGILAAMDKEVALLLPLIGNTTEVDYDGVPAYVGAISGKEVCVMKCGIGKVNSAMNAMRLLSHFHPDIVINSGVAGGADPSIKIGSVLICTHAAYHDVWCGPSTTEGQMDACPARFEMNRNVVDLARKLPDAKDFKFGLICSGDRFISKEEEVAHIKSLYPDALACDMESASIAQVCHAFNVPFIVIRVVSDTPGQGENLSQYRNFWIEAPEKTFHAVRSLIENL